MKSSFLWMRIQIRESTVTHTQDFWRGVRRRFHPLKLFITLNNEFTILKCYLHPFTTWIYRYWRCCWESTLCGEAIKNCLFPFFFLNYILTYVDNDNLETKQINFYKNGNNIQFLTKNHLYSTWVVLLFFNKNHKAEKINLKISARLSW